jgi:hypothetical protein
MGEIENAISGGALFASYSDTLAAGLLVVLLLLLLDQLNLLLGSRSLIGTSQDAGRYSEGPGGACASEGKEILAKRALFRQLVVSISIANWL